MTALSDYAEKLLIDYCFNTEVVTRPTSWYIALYTAAPSDSGGGTEVSGNGYARDQVTFDAGASPGGTTQNASAAIFTASGGNFGTITHFAVFDSLSGGNMLAWTAMDTNRTVNDGETLTFAIGDIDIALA